MKENIEIITNGFYNSFQSSHVLLLIGQNADANEVKEYLSKPRWSAVITTNSDPEFASYFATENRTLQTCSSRKELSSRFLSREKPLLVQLYGVEGEVSDTSETVAPNPFGDDERRLRKASELLSLIPSLLDYVNTLVVTGFDSEADKKLLPQLGDLLNEDITPGSVSFWGMKDAFSDNSTIKDWLKSICDQQSFKFYDTSLVEAVKYRDAEDLHAIEGTESLSFGDDVFFCNQKPVSINRDTILRIRNVGTLLTERTINRIRPLGRNQQRLWFSNFLERTGIGEPQWYGYLPQSSFHVKRDYEDALVQLVRWALRGWGPTGDQAEIRPIILSGAPGSSKSVTMGALAYRIYKEGLNPVVFISGSLFLGNSYGSGFRNLIDALETIQAISGATTPVLVIWDGSSYREIESDAKRLLTNLKNRGRNVVLVCSSYSLAGSSEPSTLYSYDNSTDLFEGCQNFDDAAVVDRSDCLFVLASRHMTEQERYQFWKKARSYSGISEVQISYLRKKFAEEPEADIFNYYYGLVSLLRERLESSLEGEQDKVVRFLQEERPDYIKELLEQKTAELESNPVYQAFLRAGMPTEALNELTHSDEGTESGDDWHGLLVRANKYIALFSRYKIDIPYSFIYEVVTKEAGVNPYSDNGRELLETLTTRIPWLSCGENEDEEFVFRFRNALEARIYLDNRNITGEKLVEMVAEALRLYGENYQRERYENPRLAQKLQSIVRLMGPNSKYYVSESVEHRDTIEHKDIQAHLDILIDAIEELLNDYTIPDEDCGFTLLLVTLTREYYGGNVWDALHGRAGSSPVDYNAPGFSADDYVKRLTRVSRASSIALMRQQELEERASINRHNEQGVFLQRQANGLVVESTLCSLEAAELSSQYADCCAVTNQKKDESITSRLLPYPAQYQKLAAAIRFDPFNGYAYNTLFRLFEKEYQSSECPSDAKLEYLAEIMAHVDNCVIYGSDIESRGQRTDELSNHIVSINNYASSVPASIDTIEGNSPIRDTRDTSLFVDIYNRFLEEGNPAAILFVARKEILQLGSDDVLSASDIRRCQRVLDFMTEQRRYECVCSDPNAIAFLIRVAWMSFSGTQLNEARECQTTKISIGHWRNLLQYCRAYSQAVQSGRQQPILTVIHALATLQVEGLTTASYIDAYNIIQPIKEEQFNRSYRLRAPFIVCDENGEPVRYTGKVIHTTEKNGHMHINGLPQYFGGNAGVYFHLLDLAKNRQMPNEGEVISGLELGIGYMGFRVFSKQMREERERR